MATENGEQIHFFLLGSFLVLLHLASTAEFAGRYFHTSAEETAPVPSRRRNFKRMKSLARVALSWTSYLSPSATVKTVQGICMVAIELAVGSSHHGRAIRASTVLSATQFVPFVLSGAWEVLDRCNGTTALHRRMMANLTQGLALALAALALFMAGFMKANLERCFLSSLDLLLLLGAASALLEALAAGKDPCGPLSRTLNLVSNYFLGCAGSWSLVLAYLLYTDNWLHRFVESDVFVNAVQWVAVVFIWQCLVSLVFYAVTVKILRLLVNRGMGDGSLPTLAPEAALAPTRPEKK